MIKKRSIAPAKMPTDMPIKGEAQAMPEPKLVWPKASKGRRVGAVLPNALFAEFRRYAALSGKSGDQLIREAIEEMVSA
jgi:hypothetical protein